MEVFALGNFNKFKPSTITTAQFSSYLSYGGDHDLSTIATYLCILLQLIFTKQMISPLLTTMWYHMDGCS